MSKTYRGEMPDTYHPLTPEQKTNQEARRAAEGVIKEARQVMGNRKSSLAERHAATINYRKAAKELNYELIPLDPEMPEGMKDPKNEAVTLEEFAAFERWSDKQQAVNADRLADEADRVATIKFRDAGLARARSEALKREEDEATPRATTEPENLVRPVLPRRPRGRAIMPDAAKTVLNRPEKRAPSTEMPKKPQDVSWLERFKGLFGG